MSTRILSASTILLSCIALSLPASVLAKPQLDAEKYTGAQKAEAQACNKANAAHAAITQSGEEIERLNTSINAAQHEVQDAAKGAANDAAKAKVADLKAKRKAEEGKLKQAQADELVGKKEHRKALKQAKQEKAEPLNCL